MRYFFSVSVYVIKEYININNLSKNNAKIIDYMNNPTALGRDMAVRNHARFSENSKPSSLDHMFTNLTKKDTYRYIALYELSDHLPIFYCKKTQNIL